MTGITSEWSDTGLRALVSTQPMFHRVFRAEPFAVRIVLADVRRRFSGDITEDTLGRLELVLAEVMNNVVEHGSVQPGQIEKAPVDGSIATRDAVERGAVEMGAGVTAQPVPRVMPSVHLCIVRHELGLSCAITDDGASLPADCLLPRALPGFQDDSLPEGGFGWYLIQDLTQSLCYYREGRRNFLAFCIPFSEAA